MKKFLLVVLIGIAVAISIYGLINEYLIDDEIVEIDHIDETTTAVYLE